MDTNQNIGNGKRIAKNTLMLYFRQALIMLVSLYSVRVVLNVLGAEDYGVYNVTAGVVSAFGFLTGAMAAASQRYFSYDLGQNNIEKLQRTFSITFEIYILLVIFVVIIAETIGAWFVWYKLVIPTERRIAAFWLYQTVVLSFIFSLITTPYMSLLIAHENMNVYAYVSIIEAILKLGIVFLLKMINWDKLILYGILICTVSFINTSLYRIYCKTHYKESKFHFIWDFAMFKEILLYSGWNLFGSISDVVKNQGLNILLNLFFGPIVNAARGIAMQVSIATNSFAQNFSLSVRPQIIKKYANNENESLLNLVYLSSKGTFILLYIFALPLMLEMNKVLTLWLKNVPDSAEIFTILVLIEVIITSTSLPMMSLIQATGRIKWYQIIVGGSIICNLPVSYCLLHFINSPLIVFWVNIGIAILALVLRLILVKKEVSFFSIKSFIRKVILPVILVIIFAFIPAFLVIFFMKQSFLRLIITIIVSVITVSFFSYIFGLTKEEKVFFVNFIRGKVKWRK